MAIMGKRPLQSQEPLYILAEHLPKTAAHPYYRAANTLLAQHGFDAWVEEVCVPFYAQTRPSWPGPGQSCSTARTYAPCVCGEKFRICMSSIKRCRKLVINGSFACEG